MISFGSATFPVLFLTLITALAIAVGVFAWKGIGPFEARQTRTSNRPSRAGVGCPVMLTSGPDFRGASLCLQVGRYGALASLAGNNDQAFAFREGVRSCEVRPGYRVTLFAQPEFLGATLLDRAGPSSFVAYSKKEALSPASAVVSLVRSQP